MQAQLIQLASVYEARAISFHHNQTDPIGSSSRSGFAGEHDKICRTAIGDESLRSADDVLVTRAHTAGHDMTYLALSGALHAIGPAGGPPVIPVNLLGDFGGGSMYLVTGLLAALWEAQRSGRCQVVDAAIVDGVGSLTTLLHGMMAAGQWSTDRRTNLLDGGRPWYDVYETSDHRWMAVGALEAKFFIEFCRLLPLDADESDRADPATWPSMRQCIDDACLTRTRDEWEDVFADTDACVAPVLSLIEAGDHPHLRHRATYIETEGIRRPAPAPRFSCTPVSPARQTYASGPDDRGCAVVMALSERVGVIMPRQLDDPAGYSAAAERLGFSHVVLDDASPAATLLAPGQHDR